MEIEDRGGAFRSLDSPAGFEGLASPGMGVSTDKIRHLILSKDAQPKIF